MPAEPGAIEFLDALWVGGVNLEVNRSGHVCSLMVVECVAHDGLGTPASP